MRFCENPKCPHHVNVLYGNGLIYLDYSKSETGERKYVGRVEWYSETKSIFLCDKCAEAVRIIEELKS